MISVRAALARTALACSSKLPREALSRSLSTTAKKAEELRICFVPTPMSTYDVPNRNRYWSAFDKRYYMTHPELTPVDAGIWELPHWIPWLAGVLKAQGFKHVTAMTPQGAVPRDLGINEAEMAAQIAANPADVYLHSPMTCNLHIARQMARVIKGVNPTSVNVFGGVISTPLHEEVASDPAIDFVVRDRGEYALPELLSGIAGQRNLRDVKNLTYRTREGQLHVHPELHPYMDPPDLPFPFHDIFPKELGEKLRYIRQNWSIGCPFKCSFCTIQTIGRKPGYFPAERVIAEIEAYRAHYGKHHNVYFGDETFTLNKGKTIEICTALKAKGNITFDMQTRLMSLNNDEMLDALRDGGCKWVEVGIETIVQDSMGIHKQSTNLGKLEGVLMRLRDRGIPVCSFIVNGLPEQTPDAMRRSVDIVCDLVSRGLLHATYFNAIVPYPGSAMYAAPEKFGMRIKTHEYKLYCEETEPVYDTPLATSEEIHQVYLEGVVKMAEVLEKKPFLGTELSPEKLAKLGNVTAHV